MIFTSSVYLISAGDPILPVDGGSRLNKCVSHFCQRFLMAYGIK